MTQELSMQRLLDFLSSNAPPHACEWQGWQIQRIMGGANNLLYRAMHAQCDLVVKFTIRDARDRAGREYHALLALQQAGLDIAPRPIWLDHSRYAQPVVVQTWLDGAVHAGVPRDATEWEALLDLLVTLHTLTPQKTQVKLPPAALSAANGAEAKALVYQNAARIPEPQWPRDMRAVLKRFDQVAFLEWPAPQLVLCRADPNLTNFIRRPGAWAAVDWENAGWGDPAFEVADMVTHPAYLAVTQAQWEQVIARYCELRADSTLHERIEVYRRALVVWWVVRMSRYL
jgi:aminoglycoside phosphotransferase (APT) family kinase protein